MDEIIANSWSCVRRGLFREIAVESEDYFSKWGKSGTANLKYKHEHLIILTASQCLLRPKVWDKIFDDFSALFHDLDNGCIRSTSSSHSLPINTCLRCNRARARIAEILASIIKSRKLSGRYEDDMLQCFIDSIYKDVRSTTEIMGLLIAALFGEQHMSSVTSMWTDAYVLAFENFLTKDMHG